MIIVGQPLRTLNDQIDFALWIIDLFREFFSNILFRGFILNPLYLSRIANVFVFYSDIHHVVAIFFANSLISRYIFHQSTLNLPYFFALWISLTLNSLWIYFWIYCICFDHLSREYTTNFLSFCELIINSVSGWRIQYVFLEFTIFLPNSLQIHYLTILHFLTTNSLEIDYRFR